MEGVEGVFEGAALDGGALDGGAALEGFVKLAADDEDEGAAALLPVTVI